jgi:prevent-host-death family protein
MNPPPDTTIGTSNAKAHFSALLARVAAGEEIAITRHGVPVACLVPARPIASAQTRHEAIRLMRQLASRNRLGGLRVKALIREGRS